ncbi:MAG: LysE family translocator [Pseudomonadales bacterium]|nr:LysE family translocator [Pseudomonadales bacterium]MCP5357143.1 LysE family translocator [Pseudomonadales bacterium]
MNAFLTDPLFLTFLLSSLALALTPGPAVLYIVTQTVTQGRRAGFLTVAGVAAGGLCNAVGAALGLAMLFSVSALAFTVVKLAGCGYLIYLGWQALRPGTPAPLPSEPALPRAHLFRDGFLVAALNPKTALFFAAFLPQFISPEYPAMAQSLAFAACFLLIAACTDSAYVLASGLLSQRLALLREGSSRGRLLQGWMFIALGIGLALTGNRPQISATP